MCNRVCGSSVLAVFCKIPSMYHIIVPCRIVQFCVQLVIATWQLSGLVQIMGFASLPSAQSFRFLKFKPTWCFSGEMVTTASGNPVEIHCVAEDFLGDVLKNIADQIDVCRCKLGFVSEFGEVKPGLKVKRWHKDMQAGKLRLRRIGISCTDKDLKSYYTEGRVCLRCLREAGFQAKDFIDEKIRLTAVEFRAAGYTLKELLHCFPEDPHPLRIHPPMRSFTLFDCQLKDAGYDAKDFKDAGYHAGQLSERACYHCEDPKGLTPGDFEWLAYGAYFTASELVSAGYGASELLAARFTGSELLSAGCTFEELENARRLKRRRIV